MDHHFPQVARLPTRQPYRTITTAYQPASALTADRPLVERASAGIPVTHRAVANEFMVCTARLRGGAMPDLPPYSATRTTVFLMAVGKLPELSALLAAAGYPQDCPAALVERGTQPDERVARGTVATVAAVAVEQGIKAPAVFVVGNCVNALQ